MLNPIQQTQSAEQTGHQAETYKAVGAVISLFSSGLPTIDSWRAALLKIPFDCWEHELRTNSGRVTETVSLSCRNLDFAINATFSLTQSCGEDLNFSSLASASCYYRPIANSLPQHDQERDTKQIDLDNFPETITQIIETLRQRLIEGAKFNAILSEALIEARNWKENELWGRTQLAELREIKPDRALTGEKLDSETAENLARKSVADYRPISEEGDSTDFDRVLVALKFPLFESTLTAVRFEATMSDCLGNTWPDEYLYIIIKDTKSAKPREAEFFFDRGFGEDFAKFEWLVRVEESAVNSDGRYL